MLSVGSPTPRIFTAEDIALLQTFADQAAIAIHNALAREVLAKQAERLRILHEIDRAVITEQAPVAIAEAVLGRLRDLLGVPRAIVNLFDLETGEVEWLAAVGRHRMHLPVGQVHGSRVDLHRAVRLVVQAAHFGETLPSLRGQDADDVVERVAPVGRGSPSASTAGKRTGSAASLAQVSELARCPSGFPPPKAGTGWAKLTVQSFAFEPQVEPPGVKTSKANVPPPQLATTLWKILP